MKWNRKKVIVTGGAGFIGANMCNALLNRGAEITVVDKLQIAIGSLAWNRKLSRLERIFSAHGVGSIPLEICDLETERQRFQLLCQDADVVFHLSAVFGGREFVDTRQVDCSKMFAVDHNAIEAAQQAGVERFHYSSSACFPAGTKVWTSEGTKSIEDVKVGDRLIDQLGQVGAVEQVSSRWHQGSLRRIWVGGFDQPIDATPEHPFLTEVQGKTGWTPAEQIEGGSRVLVPRIRQPGIRPAIDLRAGMSERETAYVELQQAASMGRANAMATLAAYGVKDPDVRYWTWTKDGEKPQRLRAVSEVFPWIDVDADVAWWLGIYLAEGWTEGGDERPSQILITLGDEPELEARVIDVASRKLGLRVHRREMKRQAGVKLEATHPLLATWLEENFGKGARAKKIPTLILQADEVTVRNFLHGYLEGDGCISERPHGRRPRVIWATASKEMSTGLQMLFARLGLSPGYSVRKPTRVIQDREVHSVESTQSYLDGWQSVELLRQLGLDSRTENSPKYQRARRFATADGEWISRRVVKVEDIPFAGMVYNCQVSPNHSYCVGDGVAVHNCVYPDSLQKDRTYLLKEDDILSTGEGWLSADNLYGFAKLMGELQCVVFHKEKGLKTSVCRYLTVYGPGEFDTSHAISALIERALDREDPYVIWGSGNQERGFTFVEDIVEGSILAAEKVEDGTGLNLGWDKRYNMKEVAGMILRISGYSPKLRFDRTKPEGPFSRALDISKSWKVLGWKPRVDLQEGLERTIAWHRESRAEGKRTKAPARTS